jgi:hypothetical protein
MFDIDWNPANDKQAMSRIWREGQSKPVFIYRMICQGSIEEAMLQRQNSKADLATAVGDTSNLKSVSDLSRQKSSNRQSLTKKDILLLLSPNDSSHDSDEIELVDNSSRVLDDENDIDTEDEQMEDLLTVSTVDDILNMTSKNLGPKVLINFFLCFFFNRFFQVIFKVETTTKFEE